MTTQSESGENVLMYEPFTAMKDSFIGLIRQERFMNNSMELPRNLLEVYAADTGQLLLRSDLLLDHQIELTKKMNGENLFSLHSNFGNMSPVTHLALWSDHQSILYSINIDLGGNKNAKGELSFIPKVEVMQNKSLTFKPNHIISAKQKAAYKIVAWNESAKSVHVYSHDLLQEEMVVEVDTKFPMQLKLMQ